MSINLHHLRLFTAVVDHGGFTKAAAQLGLSQPAISKSLSEFERSLNVRLIDRNGRTPRLTQAGRALHARAREIFGIERLAERELREIRGLKRGRLRVAASPTIATYLLPPVLARFHRRRPTVMITARQVDDETVLKLLLESHVDVALSEYPIEHELVEVVPWRDDELVVVASGDHDLRSRDRVVPEHLADYRFLVSDRRCPIRRAGERAFADRGVRLRTMRVGSSEAIKQGVAAGLGLGVVSRVAATDLLELGRLAIVPVDGFGIRRVLSRLRLRSRVPGISPAARELELLLDEASSGDVESDATGVSAGGFTPS
ncbi:MAG TPA: LysR family transcriptional regulator [Gemmatimonadaceae bacterium]|nr:LysR family transcriptional regulator [Gemmatimonadaceae bacterium]